VNDYYDARNSLLPDVLRTRRGIPITLALLYIELASQVGLEAAGISFPGHFLVKLHMPRGEVVIDPFTGHSLSRDELDERLLPYRRQRGLTGDFEAPLGLFLQAAPPRDVIARLLRNLKEIHRTGEDWARLLPVLERLVVLLPEVWEERRDRGLARAELGLFDGAAADLRCYLDHRPLADDAPALLRRVAELRDSGSPRWH
jgi:regulator of sirC expression with transglutaminase-like and TPR domain